MQDVLEHGVLFHTTAEQKKVPSVLKYWVIARAPSSRGASSGVVRVPPPISAPMCCGAGL